MRACVRASIVSPSVPLYSKAISTFVCTVKRRRDSVAETFSCFHWDEAHKWCSLTRSKTRKSLMKDEAQLENRRKKCWRKYSVNAIIMRGWKNGVETKESVSYAKIRHTSFAKERPNMPVDSMIDLLFFWTLSIVEEWFAKYVALIYYCRYVLVPLPMSNMNSRSRFLLKFSPENDARISRLSPL